MRPDPGLIGAVAVAVVVVCAALAVATLLVGPGAEAALLTGAIVLALWWWRHGVWRAYRR